MRYIADFHIHSKYSRATSKEMVIPQLEKWAKIKGINILGTGDFTHPFWSKELRDNLATEGNGLYFLKSSDKKVFFILTTEISCIYSQGGKVRRIHLIVFAPNLEIVEKINKKLSTIGNLSADGRPILGISAKELTKIILDICPDCLVVPGHAWTPWFSVFGSNSGFDSLRECFEEVTRYIYSIETGLSSDPKMNWRLSALDNITLISCSDAHSPNNLGRESCVFEIPENQLSYQEVCRILKEKDKNRFLYTIEFFPEEGKYHWDGHRICGVSFSPQETKKYQGVCPQCRKPLTIGVINRVEKLADRPEGFILKNTIGYKSLVPLKEIIAESLGQTKNTKKVKDLYQQLIQKGNSEFDILLDFSYEQLSEFTLPEIVLGIKNVREGKIKAIPGYDGVYGQVKVFGDKKTSFSQQKTLF